MGSTNFNPSYIGARRDIQSLIPASVRNVLDVGCSVGSLGAAIKEKSGGAQVFGIELSEQMAEEANACLDKVFQGDVAEVIRSGQLDGFTFDAIIFADILEHLIDPWTVLREIKKHLNPKGIIVASIPNIRNLDTIFNLVVKGYWPYRERGIHDATHLRFFTKKNIIELFEAADLSISYIQTNYRLVEKPNIINGLARFFAFPIIKNFLAFQYLIKSHHKAR